MGNLFCRPAPSDYVLLCESQEMPVVIYDEFFLMDRDAAWHATGCVLPENVAAVLFHYVVQPAGAATDVAYAMTAADLGAVTPEMRNPRPEMLSSDRWAERNSKFYNVRCSGAFKGIRYFPSDLLRHLTPIALPPVPLYLQ